MIPAVRTAGIKPAARQRILLFQEATTDHFFSLMHHRCLNVRMKMSPLEIASEINRRSLNGGAELLLQWAAGREKGPNHLMDHVYAVTGQSQGVYLVDGSGLSYDDRVTAATFVSYLAKFPATAAGRNFPQLLPSNGTGTLRQLNSGFPASSSAGGHSASAASIASS